MVRTAVVIIASIAVLGSNAAFPQAAPAPAPAAEAPKPTYTTADTPVGTLLDDPAAHALLDRYVPTVSHGDQIDMARGMTLRMLQQYAPDDLSDKILAELDAELAKLPIRK